MPGAIEEAVISDGDAEQRVIEVKTSDPFSFGPQQRSCDLFGASFDDPYVDWAVTVGCTAQATRGSVRLGAPLASPQAEAQSCIRSD